MKKLGLIVLLGLATATFAAPKNEKTITVDDPFTSLIKNHLQLYGEQEFYSAIQVSIKSKDKISNYVAGTKARGNSSLITSSDLFDIGSITKSFTAALTLIAEREGKLKLDNPLADYLSSYPHWGKQSITRLLNMSTGIPDYAVAPKLNYLFSKNLQQYWSQKQLVDLVYSTKFNPPLKSGYFYSNTGYILMDMVLSNQYKMPFKTLLEERLIKPLSLSNTFYPVPNYPAEVLQRLVRGYSYDVYANPELLGRDVSENNLSWGGAAGAIVANSEDIIHWIDALFIGDKLLTVDEKKKMQTLISMSTGKPLSEANTQEMHAFGLGIAQGYNEQLGRFWYYRGETLGHRSYYVYIPCNQVIVSALVNSATNDENDHTMSLLEALYQQVLLQDTSLQCQPSEPDSKKAA